MADLHRPNSAVAADAPAEKDTAKQFSIPDLQDNSIYPTLWYRIHILLFDLENFKERTDASERLERVNDISYLGEPYFSSKESSAIKNTTMNGRALSNIIQDNLEERLQRRIKKRVDSGDYRVCAAHDLAPILATALGIDLKQLRKDEEFTDIVEKNGLNWDGKWNGLAKRSFALKKTKKHRR
ncbi:hypothetical protein P170DRAFT_507279 [Aspergillus steynii IBT 23096]|uniref:Uncharacterized protein n=1 Tax=Aspergillus steynii IBT 23096 TaxID=1392250 RepID=A0A2I2GI03_9EURO|nr:uncharacterized protein P170DRAFT_507279 [Aspergillus steynii IBT 23096]PLB52509.1 hypothetical protein P170DRAFT_507279 [Aspergillus steynii IBT 23096]